MKKLLLTLAAVVGLGFAATADEVTFDFVGNGTDNLYGMTRLSGSTSEYNPDPTTVKDGAVSITLTGNTRLWKDGLRFYKSSAMEITAPGYTVTAVTFNANGTSFNYNNAALTGNDWTGKEDAVKFACNISSKNKAVGKLTITIEKKGDASKGDANLSFAETNFTVNLADGFIAPTLVNPNNLAVEYASSDVAVATVAADGKVTLVGPGTTKITATSAETDKFNAGSASYTLTVIKTYTTVADFYTVGKDGKGIIGFDLIVTYVKDQNCYAETADGEATLIYGATPYAVGDVIPAGWEGQYTPYNGMPEIKPVGTLPAASETGKTVTYKEATEITLDMVNQIVVLKGVTFDAATQADKTNFTGKIGETSIAFRNNFAVASVEAGRYDVTCAVGYYGAYNATEPTDAAKLQVYPIEYNNEAYVGIEDIEADNNAPVEYFNLQGVRVANPENGLFIRRQGNKVTKVIVK